MGSQFASLKYEYTTGRNVCTVRPHIGSFWEAIMAVKKKVKKRIVRPWSKEDHRQLKAHSKAKTPVAKISKMMKRTVGALRQQALKLGIPLGHNR
jgi:hypothetical protein